MPGWVAAEPALSNDAELGATGRELHCSANYVGVACVRHLAEGSVRLHRLERLMHARLAARPRPRPPAADPGDFRRRRAANLLDRAFSSPLPTANDSDLRISGGRLLYSRRSSTGCPPRASSAGSMSATMTAELVVDARLRHPRRGGPGPAHHSDAQPTPAAVPALDGRSRHRLLVSRPRQCLGHAVMELFSSQNRTNGTRTYRTRDEAGRGVRFSMLLHPRGVTDHRLSSPGEFENRLSSLRMVSTNRSSRPHPSTAMLRIAAHPPPSGGIAPRHDGYTLSLPNANLFFLKEHHPTEGPDARPCRQSTLAPAILVAAGSGRPLSAATLALWAHYGPCCFYG